jgi:hypothetical protein
VVLQWCYSGVTVVLQWCYSGVTVVVQWCCHSVVIVSDIGPIWHLNDRWNGRMLHCCYTVVTLLLQCCHTVVTVLSHCCYTVVTLLSHCCYTDIGPIWHLRDYWNGALIPHITSAHQCTSVHIIIIFCVMNSGLQAAGSRQQAAEVDSN